MEYYSIQDIERAAERANNHFFDRESKRFFRSRILSDVYQGLGGVYFVTSEQFHNAMTGYTAERRYTVRQFIPGTEVRESDGREVPTVKISTVGEFNQLTRAEAIRQAKKCAAGREALEEVEKGWATRARG